MPIMIMEIDRAAVAFLIGVIRSRCLQVFRWPIADQSALSLRTIRIERMMKIELIAGKMIDRMISVLGSRNSSFSSRYCLDVGWRVTTYPNDSPAMTMYTKIRKTWYSTNPSFFKVLFFTCFAGVYCK